MKATDADQVKQTLCELADLTCEVDHRKNSLPAIYRPEFTRAVGMTHSHIKSIARDHGVVVYDDQEEKGRANRETY